MGCTDYIHTVHTVHLKPFLSSVAVVEAGARHTDSR